MQVIGVCGIGCRAQHSGEIGTGPTAYGGLKGAGRLDAVEPWSDQDLAAVFQFEPHDIYAIGEPVFADLACRGIVAPPALIGRRDEYLRNILAEMEPGGRFNDLPGPFGKSERHFATHLWFTGYPDFLAHRFQVQRTRPAADIFAFQRFADRKSCTQGSDRRFAFFSGGEIKHWHGLLWRRGSHTFIFRPGGRVEFVFLCPVELRLGSWYRNI